MDISRFAAADFDVKAWVNAAFRAQQDGPAQADAHAATLVLKLQVLIQEVNNVLQGTAPARPPARHGRGSEALRKCRPRSVKRAP